MARERVVLLGTRLRSFTAVIILVSLILWAGPFGNHGAFADQIVNRSLVLSTAEAGGHNVTYNITFTPGSAGPVGSIEFEFCSNSALIEDSCTAPYGFDALNANVVSQSGTAGFFKSPSSSVNDIIVAQAPALALSTTPINFTFDSVVNPTDEGSYYLKVFTYANSTATGSPVDFGAMAFPINPAFNVSAEVPPFLTFCAGITIDGFDCGSAAGSQLDFGQFNTSTSNDGQSQILAATNAQSGYTIYDNGITMTSGNNVIPAMQSEASKVGTSQFGINLRANTVPQIGEDPDGPGTGSPTTNYNQPNKYRFTAGEALATASVAQDYKKYTISYLVNVAKDQPPGVYSTTLTYVCLANF